jgi:biopolymer transport protein ExbD
MTEVSTRNHSRKASRSAIMARPLKLWQDNSQNQEVRIEIVPLIDVIFCILTFFILGAVGLSRQQAIQLDLPKASTGTPQMREMLVVSLDDFGQVYVEKQLVTRKQLYEALKNYQQYNPNGLMVLHASRNVSYNEVAQVLDTLRQVGGNRVALATLPGEASSPDNLSYPSFQNLPPSGSNLPQNYANPLPSDPSASPRLNLPPNSP